MFSVLKRQGSKRNQKMGLDFRFVLLLCSVLEISCFNRNSECVECRNSYTRIKRAKFYQSPPLAFYNRPHFSPPIRGPFSYTPPPGYTANDIGPHPSNLRPYKVSKRPITEGFGDEDINKLIKYLSKKDLQKVIDFANEKERREKYREPNGNSYEYSPSDQDFYNVRVNDLSKPSSSETKHTSEDNPNAFFNTQLLEPMRSHQINSQIHNQEEAGQEEQLSFLDAYIHKDIQDMSPENSVIFTDSSTMQEEVLPKPINLRENDYETSFTNNVQSVVRPDVSYKIESFARLPLMEYSEHSKLYSVDSYKVPHYSVTSGNQPTRSTQSLSSLSSRNNAGAAVEPAPPASVAKDVSDAHLKAIKIWTHKSKGTAYTLHDDGTLTLEKTYTY